MDKKISQLTSATLPLTGLELLPVVQSGQTVGTTAQDIADLAGGVLPVETVYPTTDALKAGTRFWYKGNEWHYMTQDEIDSAGWTGLVSVGFPAPVSKNYNSFIYTPDLKIIFQTTSSSFSILYENQTFFCDFLGLGDPTKARIAINLGAFSTTPYTISFRNVNLLTNLENSGTTSCFIARYGNLTQVSLNNLFTDLPPTTKTATIDVRDNPGSATCNPTIATSKGYTVLV